MQSVIRNIFVLVLLGFFRGGIRSSFTGGRGFF